MVMLHPVNHLSTRCTTSMASLLLSFRSSQEGRDTLYIDVLVTDRHLVVDTTSACQNSNTYCGNTYHLPSGYSVWASSCRFYAGSYRFTPTDVEVFYETTT